MRIAYLYERDVSEGDDMDCEKVYADWKNTKRADLSDLIDTAAAKEGDTVCVRALSDLGRGKEAELNRKRLERKGVKVLVVPGPDRPKVTGRKPRVEVTDECGQVRLAVEGALVTALR